MPIIQAKHFMFSAIIPLTLQVDKEANKWEITEKGQARLDNPPPPPKPTTKPTTTIPLTQEEELSDTVPSQSDIFRAIGGKLGVGVKKGDVRLDPLIYYLQKTADFDNLNSVWNALTEITSFIN